MSTRPAESSLDAPQAKKQRLMDNQPTPTQSIEMQSAAVNETTNNNNNKNSNVRVLGHAVLHRPNYTGHTLLSMHGVELAKIPEKRFHWYLRKNLATQVDDLTIRLKFEAAGNGNAGDEYYMSEHKNHCVVCGDESHYTRHHVVPHEYRRCFPLELKSSNSHDILLLCSNCHEVYETEAMKLKKGICEQYKVNINGYGKERDQSILKAKSWVNALMNHRSKIPHDRVLELNRSLNQFLVERGIMSVPDIDTQILQDQSNNNNNNEVNSDQMMDDNEEKEQQIDCPAWMNADVPLNLMSAVLNMDEWIGLDQFVTHGEGVVKSLLEGADSNEERIRRMDEFAISWRQHFVDIMNPKHINPHWSVTRSMKRK